MTHYHSLNKFAPEVIGNEYLVVGTIEKRVWQQGVRGEETEVEEILKHVADFKKVYDLEYDPGGWYPAEAVRGADESRYWSDNSSA